MQLIKFRDIWNEGWVANWEDDSWKYVIYFYRNQKRDRLWLDRPLGWSPVLCFKTTEIRDKFSETFDDIIHTAKPLL